MRAPALLASVLLAVTAQDLRADTTLPIAGAPGQGFQVPWHQIRPEQLLILVNSDDAQSVEVADEYMARYRVPAANRLDLDFHRSMVLDSDDFEPLYHEITDFLRDRSDLEAIVITWTEPWKVSPQDTTAGMSITSAVTFGFRDEYYNSQGGNCSMTAVSPLYGQDLSSPYTDFGVRPAMMLAGETAQNAIDVIDRGIAAKSTFPLQTAYLFRTTDDYRSIRYEQMEDAAVFWDHDFGLAIDYRDNSDGSPEDNYLRDADDVLFYFTGLVDVDYLETLHFLPGAVADHLTSSGGALTNTSQMSILRWLEAGATGSFGTVTEPCSATDKFPNVDMLMQRYFAGATLIDAYWQSVRMPGEGIFVGDPLAQPWAAQAQLNGSGQVELITTGLPDYHVYKVMGVKDGVSSVLLNGVQVDSLQLHVLTLPSGFDAYKLDDTGTMYVNHGAPHLTSDSITTLPMPDGATRFHVRASDPQNDDVYYSFQPANGNLLDQTANFTAELLLDGDIDRDGYVNFGDVSAVKAAMWSQVGGPGYDAEADLNNDGVINFGDVALLKANFGGTRTYVRISAQPDTNRSLTIMAFDRWGSESRITAHITDGSFLIAP